jgi:carboxypeptidase C (cathepsin A)
MIRTLTAALGALAIAGGAFAQAPDTENDPREPRVFESRGEVTANGERIRYRATAGETFLRDEDGKAVASIFATSYVREGVNDPRQRPVAFIFNGGPGSASLWLHMGVFGPVNLVLPSDGDDDGAAPYEIGPNSHTLLDQADMVFIDPVGTGYSRALGDADPQKFWGVREDAEWLGQFIRTWLTENRRWNSPKYLIGESYGTTRIGALMNELELGWNNVAFNGVVLVSSVLEFSNNRPTQPLGYAGLLPGYAATAWYHEKVDRDAWDGDYDAFLRDARDFTTDEYLPVLLRGRDVEPERFDATVERMSALTGLSEDYLRSANLIVPLNRFRNEILREEGVTVGRFDSRYTGQEPDGVRENPEGDPSGYGIAAGYTAAMRDHYTRNLGVDITDTYVTLGGVRDWNWNAGEAGGNNSFVNVSMWLERAMRQNTDLRVLVTNGIYDLATPFFGTEMTFNRLAYDPERVTMTYYEAGHMMYLHHPSLEALAEDVRDFIRDGN